MKFTGKLYVSRGVDVNYYDDSETPSQNVKVTSVRNSSDAHIITVKGFRRVFGFIPKVTEGFIPITITATVEPKYRTKIRSRVKRTTKR